MAAPATRPPHPATLAHVEALPLGPPALGASVAQLATETDLDQSDYNGLNSAHYVAEADYNGRTGAGNDIYLFTLRSNQSSSFNLSIHYHSTTGWWSVRYIGRSRNFNARQWMIDRCRNSSHAPRNLP